MVPVPAAYLRVYEPLSSFDPEQQRTWTAYVDKAPPREVDSPGGRAYVGADPDWEDASVGAPSVGLWEAQALAATLVRPEAVTDVELDQAFVVVEDDVTYVCPWRSGLRAWEGLVSFRSVLPPPLADAYCPEDIASRVEAELDAWKRLHPGMRSHVLTNAWVVPIRWFVCFEPVERSVVLRPEVSRALWYRTRMSRVRRRVTRALTIVRDVFGPGGPTAEVEALERWLDQFHPHSLVELDYGGLAAVLGDDALTADESVTDVMDALDALADGDAERAGEAYERVVDRWRPLAALERAS